MTKAKRNSEIKPKKEINGVAFGSSYDSNKVIIDRSFGIKDLERYKKKIAGNIKIFLEAIAKEKKEKKRVQDMIDVLKADIKEAKYYKGLKKI